MTPAGTCPTHGPLPGLGTFCFDCHDYVENLEAKDAPAPARGIADTRSEDERKRDAKPAVEALGFWVGDYEQGYRLDNCPTCLARIPGGHSTRVPVGTPDWFVMGHGVAAWIEWKTDSNDQTEGQKAFQGACDVAGFPYAVVHTTRQVVDFLETLNRTAP